MVSLNDLRAAQTLLQGIAVRTPLFEWTNPTAPRKLFLKLENQQPIGAFKLRGAYNKVASLTDEERRRGVISYSSGNHAQGVAYAARALRVKAIIVMPANAPKNKREATAALGAEIVIVGPSSEERRLRAEQLAAEHGYVIVPPYNDEKIIAGQGTVGLEILEDLPEVETVLVPVGGAGLISGVSAAIKLSHPKVNIIGVEPELAADAQASLRAGHIVSWPGRASFADHGRRSSHAKRRSNKSRTHSRLCRRYRPRHRRRDSRSHAPAEREPENGRRTKRSRRPGRVSLSHRRVAADYYRRGGD